MQGIIKGMQDERMAVVTQLQARFDEVEMAPVAVVEAEAEVEAEVEAAAAAQEEGCSKAPSRRQEALSRRQERGCSKARCFDTNEARRRRMERSDSRRKERRGELLQKKRLGDHAPLAVEALMPMHAAEPENEAAPRACEAPDATCSDVELLMPLSEVELPVAFPLLELPEELQLLVAAHVVSSPRDRAALCVAAPQLGRKASKGIAAYTGP